MSTLTDRITLTAGDTATPIRARAFTADGYVNLTVFASIAFRMVGPVTVTGAATGDALGNLSYAWAAGDTATVGDYQAVWLATDGSGKTQTFPQGASLTVTIVAAV
jgi:hypothetical protein